MWKEKLLALFPSFRDNILVILLAGVGLILLGYGLISSFNKNEPEDVVFETAEETNAENKIVVDIEGAVVTPGVYSLNSDARVKDALVAASGLAQDADRDWVSKNLNLAAKLTDSAKVYIPRVGEQVFTSSNGVAGVATQSNFININSASPSELESLPGIGPVTAKKIIDNRPYNLIDDLLTKKVVGSSVFQKIKEKIAVH